MISFLLRTRIGNYFVIQSLLNAAKKETEPTLEECIKALEKSTLGADAYSISLTILWLQKDLESKSKYNKRSTKKLINWLKSEMRWYLDYGTLNPYVRDICDRYFLLRKEKLERVLEKQEKKEKENE